MSTSLDHQQELHIGMYGATAWRYSRNITPFRFLQRSPLDPSSTYTDIITGEEFEHGAMSTFRVSITKRLLCERILSGTLTNTPRELISANDTAFVAWWNIRDRHWVINYDHCHYHWLRMPGPGCAWADPESVHLVAVRSHNMDMI